MKIKITRRGKTYEAEVDKPCQLIDICYDAGFPVNFGCRIGMCGTCIVRVKKGEENISPQGEAEIDFRLDPDERMACQCAVKGDVELE